MICIEQYFKLNRYVLLLIGLWPYDRTRLAQLQATLIFGILISNIIYQLATFVFIKCTPALIIDVLSITLFFSAYATAHYFFNPHAMKFLLDELEHIYNDLKDENEIAIITKYGNIAKRITAIIILVHVCNMCTISLLILSLHLYGVFVVNESLISSRIFKKILPKFFIGQESYIYLLFLHFGGTACIGGTSFIASGGLFVACCKHACGIFRIARFTKLLFSTFERLLFYVMFFGAIALSLNLYKISETMLLDGNIEQCYFHFILTLAIFLCMFLTNYVGQEIIDYNNHVYLTAYNTRWYVAPLHIQRLILFQLQNGSKTFSMSIGGIFTLSIECFAALTKASLSYFTVVCSTQQ